MSWSELLFVRFTHDWRLLVLVVFFVLILIIVVIVGVARRDDGEGIPDQRAEVLRMQRVILSLLGFDPSGVSHIAAPPLTIF